MAYIFGSIWDRFNRNALNDLSKSVEYQGKSIQDLVAKGQLTPTQYAQLISIVNGNVKKGSITAADIDKNNFQLDQTYLTEELRQQIAGNAPINAIPADDSLTTVKYVDNSVTPSKVTFANESVNLINKQILNRNQNLSAYGELAVDNTKSHNVTNYIKTDKGKTYTIKNAYRYAIYDNLKKLKVIGTPNGALETFVSDGEFIRIAFLGLNNDKVQLEKGSVGTPYEPYYLEFESIKNDMLINRDNFNITDFDYVSAYVKPDTGEITANISGNIVSKLIELRKGETLEVSVNGPQNTVPVLTRWNFDGKQATFHSTIIMGNQSSPSINIEYTASANVEYVRLGGLNDAQLKLETFNISQSSSNQAKVYNNVLTYNATNEVLQVHSKYGTSEDIRFTFEKLMINNLFAIWKVDKKYNNSVEPSAFSTGGTNMNLSNTDWIGPYYVKAVNNSDGSGRSRTGGAHGTEGTPNEATAKTDSFVIFADGKQVTNTTELRVDSIDIYVTNSIQAYNTKSVKRYVLKERVHYHIVGATVEVDVTIEPLEEIVIEDYYGQQAAIGYYDRIYYVNGQYSTPQLTTGVAESKAGTKIDNFCSTMIISKTGTNETLTMSVKDYIGLGKREWLPDNHTTAVEPSINKAYMWLVYENENATTKGQRLKWVGSYKWNNAR